MDKIEITPEFMADLKKKAEYATPGPWEAVSCAVCLPETKDGQGILGGFNDYDDKPNERFGFGYHNAAFVAAANPQVVLALIEKIERLDEDFDSAARGEADESVKVVRLEKEADWLAKKLATVDEIPCPEHPCSRSGKDGCLQCWREAARKAVEIKGEEDE